MKLGQGARLFTATALTAVLAGSVYGQNLLVNGSFEDPTVGGQYESLTSIPGWTISSGHAVDLINSFWPAVDGVQSIDLAGTPGIIGGSLSQTFATTPGQTYFISFSYANSVNTADAAVAQLDVIGAGALIEELLTHSGSTVDNMNYVTYFRSFLADSTSTTLSFTHLSPSASLGLALDNVVIEVPETSSVVAMIGLAGTVGVAGWLRRRKK